VTVKESPPPAPEAGGDGGNAARKSGEEPPAKSHEPVEASRKDEAPAETHPTHGRPDLPARERATDAEARAEDRIPSFPWPPPKSSAFDDVTPRLVEGGRGRPERLKDVAARLEQAFEAAGYVERKYYSVPKGFALVSQMEQFDPDGRSKPPPERWSARVEPQAVFDLVTYIKALFRAKPGRFRVIVFVVTSAPITERGAVSREQAMAWLNEGANRLPASLGNLKFDDDYRISALIYEFEAKSVEDAPRFVIPSPLTGRIHIKGAGLFSSEGQR
jgi:hypothetical protein